MGTYPAFSGYRRRPKHHKEFAMRDVYDEIGDEHLERKLREIRMRPVVESSVKLLEVAASEADPALQREAVRMGIVTLRELEEDDPTVLDRVFAKLGGDRSEFNELAEQVGLPTVEPLGAPVREGEDITELRRDWRAGGVQALREGGNYALLAACPGLIEDAGIDPAAFRPHGDDDLLAHLGMDWDA